MRNKKKMLEKKNTRKEKQKNEKKTYYLNKTRT